MAKVEDIAKYIIDIFQIKAEQNLDDGMTNLRLQQLLYLAQGYHLAEYGKPLFMDEIEAWKYGPVVPIIYAKYREFYQGSIHDIPPDVDAITEKESELILNVLSKFSKYSTGYLIELSHAPDAPWTQVYEETCKNKISKESIKEYFVEKIKVSPLENEKKILLAERHKTRGKTGYILLPSTEYEDWEEYADIYEMGHLVGVV